jgi:hypothetical protein
MTTYHNRTIVPSSFQDISRRLKAAIIHAELEAGYLQQQAARHLQNAATFVSLAYRTIEKGLAYGAGRPFTAEKILTDQIEYAQRMNDNAVILPNGAGQILTPNIEVITPISASEILNIEYPEPLWLIPNLLPIGLTIFGGRPKLGKSWLVLYAAKLISTGNCVLFGEVLEEPRKVLYLALEDSRRRLQARMKQQRWSGDEKNVDFLTMKEFANDMGNLLTGGADRLRLVIDRGKYDLVLLDTLTKACFHDQNKNELMAQILSPLQSQAMENEFSYVVIDHHNKRKMTSVTDVLADIMGSTSKGATLDTAWGLYRDRADRKAELLVTGRDVDDRNLTQTFDVTTGIWEFEGETQAIKLTKARKKYVEFIQDNDGKATAKQVANALDITPQAARKMQDNTFRIQATILNTFAELQPRLTNRGIFYAAEVRGIVPKDKKGVRQIHYQLKKMRREGAIPYGWISDDTRWIIKSAAYAGLEAALENTRQTYRRDLWAQQDVHVEIWVEKKALAGIISPITEEFGVTLLPAGGYSSITFIYEAAEEIKQTGNDAFIYYFGDYEHYGKEAARKVKEGLTQEHGASINFEWVAITEEQIHKYSLPTRPPKNTTAKERKHWGNKPCVELDALPAPVLRQLVRDCITQHINPFEWDRILEIETQERKTLNSILSNLRG